ncbi:unnamed protein product [Arabis nemorensis]|uniref:Uncharacterized protein n=1 Tax=Arabis nemorensis TaxID=586526 RepID=A0A565C3R4_9BRAS|nr:unnamed protein product [Arabis nemorensis]
MANPYDWDGENVKIPLGIDHDLVITKIFDALCVFNFVPYSPILTVVGCRRRISNVSSQWFLRSNLINFKWLHEDYVEDQHIPKDAVDRFIDISFRGIVRRIEGSIGVKKVSGEQDTLTKADTGHNQPSPPPPAPSNRCFGRRIPPRSSLSAPRSSGSAPRSSGRAPSSSGGTSRTQYAEMEILMEEADDDLKTVGHCIFLQKT